MPTVQNDVPRAVQEPAGRFSEVVWETVRQPLLDEARSRGASDEAVQEIARALDHLTGRFLPIEAVEALLLVHEETLARNARLKARQTAAGTILAGHINMASPGSLVAKIWAGLYPDDETAPQPYLPRMGEVEELMDAHRVALRTLAREVEDAEERARVLAAKIEVALRLADGHEHGCSVEEDLPCNCRRGDLRSALTRAQDKNARADFSPAGDTNEERLR